MVKLGRSGLEVFPLCLGGNVFGWTASTGTSFAVLDAYADAGGNFIDTADSYCDWVDGNTGGESETIIGRWLARRKNRDEMIIATKVGQAKGLEGLSTRTIRQAAEASLRRLGTDRIDVYYAHEDDPATPLEETLAAFDALVRQGKARCIGASNYSAGRLAEALRISEQATYTPFAVVQPLYNLVERTEFEGDLMRLCVGKQIACAPYSALADGFLTGKYRPGRPAASARAADAARYLHDRGIAVLQALDQIAHSHHVSIAAVALTWLRAQPAVVAPIASARTPAQLADLLPSAQLTLTGDELGLLSSTSSAGQATPVRPTQPPPGIRQAHHAVHVRPVS